MAAAAGAAAAIAVGVPVGARSEPTAERRGTPAHDRANRAEDPAWGRGEQRAKDRQKRLASSEARAERRRSRTRFRGLTGGEALAVARRTFPEQLMGRSFNGDQPALGAEVLDQRGRGTALVRDGRRNKTLLVSTLPLLASSREDDGAVDLSLKTRGDGYAPRGSRAPLWIHRRSAAGVRLTDLGVGFRLVARERRAQVASGRAFFAEVRRDTDAFVAPLPTGVELALQVRSPESPERFTWRVDLPEGARLRRASTDDPIPGDPPQSLEIVRRGRPLAYVHPPVAHDADGLSVRAKLELLGRRRLVVEVDHRERDLRYPLAVDPEISSYSDYPKGWPGWHWEQVLYGNSQGYGRAMNDCAYHCGLYHSHPAYTWNVDGSHSKWLYRAPPNTYLYRAVFGGMSHDSIEIYERNHTDWFHGIYNDVGRGWEDNAGYVNQSGGIGPNPFGPAEHNAWGVTHDFCFYDRCSRAQGTERNWAFLGLQTNNKFANDGINADQRGFNTMSWAHVFIGDRRLPYLTAGKRGDGAWTASNTGTLRVSAHDDGLGVYAITLAGPATGSGTARAPASDGNECSGNPHWRPCRTDSTHTFDYTLDEGVTRLSIKAQDAVDNVSGTHAWVERVDRTNPTLVRADGALRQAAALGDRTYDLAIEAHDRSAVPDTSGVARIEVFVTDPSGTETRKHVATSAATTFTFDATATAHAVGTGYGEGEHAVRVRVTDGAGNYSEDSFDVYVDRTPPHSDANMEPQGTFQTTAHGIVSWAPGEDPDLSDGNAGSGVETYLVRYWRPARGWSPVVETPYPEIEFDGAIAGERVDLEVRPRDFAGNVGSTTNAQARLSDTDQCDPNVEALRPECQDAVEGQPVDEEEDPEIQLVDDLTPRDASAARVYHLASDATTCIAYRCWTTIRSGPGSWAVGLTRLEYVNRGSMQDDVRVRSVMAEVQRTRHGWSLGSLSWYSYSCGWIQTRRFDDFVREDDSHCQRGYRPAFRNWQARSIGGRRGAWPVRGNNCQEADGRWRPIGECTRGTSLFMTGPGIQCANVYAIPYGKTMSRCKKQDVIRTLNTRSEWEGYCVNWRYVTRDRRWVMVRDTHRTNLRGGWVFMPLRSFDRNRSNWKAFDERGTCNQIGA